MSVLNFFKSLLTVLVVLLFVKSLGYALGAMNQASDLSVAAGVIGTMCSIFIPYFVIKNIWRRKS